MFCRWFNHQNLNSKFRTVFCSDSSDSYPDIESIARENLCHTGQRETHIKNRAHWWISTLQAEFKVCHIDKWKRVTMNFNWMFKFLSVSSMTTHNSSHSWQNLTLTTNFYSILQFIPRLSVPFPQLSPPAQQPGQWHRAQLCWLDLRPVWDSASSVSAHYYVAEAEGNNAADNWLMGEMGKRSSLAFICKFRSWRIIWHLRWTIMQSRPAAAQPALDIFTTKLNKNPGQKLTRHCDTEQ